MDFKPNDSRIYNGPIFAFSLIPIRDRVRFSFYLLSSLFVSMLDLIAIGVISITVTFVSGSNDAISDSTVFRILTAPIDYFSIPISDSRIYVYLLILAAILLLMKTVLMTILQVRLALFLAQQQVAVSERLTREFFSGSLDRVNSISSQEVSFVLNHGVYYLINSTLFAATGIFVEGALILGTFAILIAIFPIVAISLFVFYGLILGVSFGILSRKAHRYGDEATTSYLSSLNFIQESIRLHRELLVSSSHTNFNRLIIGKIKESAHGYSMQNFLSQVPKAIFEGALVLGLVILSIYSLNSGSREVALSAISIFIVAGLRVAPSLIKLQGNFITLRNLQPSVDRVKGFCKNQIVAAPIRNSIDGFTVPTETHSNLNIRSSIFKPTLSVKNVSYKYPNETNLALEDISFEIAEGSMLGLSGMTGSGKSTLADICLGLRIPNSGNVMLGNIPADLAPKMWPRQLAYFSQKVSLISGSVAENIALGCESSDIDYERVEMLLDYVGMSDVISQKNLGALENIGEDGIKLSGGQRQRIGLARSLYWDPSFLVLDEVTSAQDEEMEGFLNTFLRNLRGTRTIILISHRQNSLNLCDKVIHLNNGKVQNQN
jgi:ABC-type multidrug transport system fused ATPase/permease subunit